MIIPYKFTYLFGSSLFLIYWFFLFYYLKNDRKLILTYSLVFAVLGPLADLLWYTSDWWQPQAAFGQITLIENILLGFTNGGIGASLYLLFFKAWRKGSVPAKVTLMYGQAPLLISLLLTAVFYWLFHFTSFYANMVGVIVALAYVYYKRPDLIKASAANGVLILFAALPVYLLIIIVSPGWIEETWMVDRLTGIMIFNIPLEDLVWYFFTGCVISIMAPWHKNYKLVLRERRIN